MELYLKLNLYFCLLFLKSIMKDRFFKSEIKSCFVDNKTPEYNGSSDLYPRRNRNLINNSKVENQAIKIQRWWRSARRNEQARKQLEQLKLEKIVKKDVPERFASWFGF